VAQALTGLKIRALRTEKGLTQIELARRAGISASYLNLIECNKRPAAGALLDRIGQGLGVDRAALDGEAEQRLAETLEEIASDPAIDGRAKRPADAGAVVGRHPDWAELVVRLYRAYNDRHQAVLALADRLNRDPFLSESVHRMLTDITSVRSAAEILESGGALSTRDNARFLSIVGSASRNLSATAQSLVGFFESANIRVRSATPMEHVDAFIFESDNYFDRLETLAAGLRDHGAVARAMAPAAPAPADGATASLPAPETARFRAVREAVAPMAADAVDGLVGDHGALGTEEARDLATAALHSYTAAAVLMPYEAFLERAEDCRYDLDILSRAFGVSYEQAAHRAATLRRPGREGVRFGYMRSDPSGYVTKRLPLPELPMPRYGTGCPLWPVYGAFQSPGTTVRCFGELPSTDRFLFFARAVEKGSRAVGMPRRLLSVMLVCPGSQAHRVVYGDGIDRSTAMLPVGTVCRLCPREDCGHRQEAPLLA